MIRHQTVTNMGTASQTLIIPSFSGCFPVVKVGVGSDNVVARMSQIKRALTDSRHGESNLVYSVQTFLFTGLENAPAPLVVLDSRQAFPRPCIPERDDDGTFPLLLKTGSSASVSSDFHGTSPRAISVPSPASR